MLLQVFLFLERETFFWQFFSVGAELISFLSKESY